MKTTALNRKFLIRYTNILRITNWAFQISEIWPVSSRMGQYRNEQSLHTLANILCINRACRIHPDLSGQKQATKQRADKKYKVIVSANPSEIG